MGRNCVYYALFMQKGKTAEIVESKKEGTLEQEKQECFFFFFFLARKYIPRFT